MNHLQRTNGTDFRRGLWPASIALLAAAVLAVLRRLPQALQGKDLFSDDAYYYIITARNFVETGRFTFDGISETNGFHPLLFWLEALGFAVFGTRADPLSQYRAVFCGMAVVLLLTIGGALLVIHSDARSRSDAVLQAALVIAMAVVLMPRFTRPYLGGMEAIVVLPLLLAVAALAWRRQYALGGLAGLLLVMARLDTLTYVLVPLVLACTWRERRRGGRFVGRGLLLLMPAVVATLAFLAFNGWYFGHAMPIHGVLKSCFPRIHWQPNQLLGSSSDAVMLWLSLATAAGALVVLLPGLKPGRGLRFAGLTAAGIGLVQLAAFVLFQKWIKPVPVWYLGPPLLCGLFAASVAAARLVGLRRLRLLATAAAVATLVVNGASLARAWRQGSLHWDAEKTAAVVTAPGDLIEFMKQQPPHDAIWACTDCGKLAFWSGRQVVNLDGLMGDFEYQRCLRDGNLARYLRDRHVKYLVLLVWDRPQVTAGIYEPMYECRVAPDVFAGEYDVAEFRVASYQYWKYSDTLRLPPTAEVWRSRAAQDGRAMGRAVVFDLELARQERKRGQDSLFGVFPSSQTLRQVW